MMPKAEVFLKLVVVLFGVTCSGCLEPIERGPATVSGIVTLDGEPVEGARVTFIPIEPNPNGTLGRMSFGVCDADGNFTLSMEKGKSDGVVAGECQVIISTRQVVTQQTDEGEEQQVEIQAERFPAHVNVKSTLRYKVPVDGTNDVRLDVVSNPETANSASN